MTELADRSALATNWSGNYTYTAERLHRPASLSELQEFVAGARRVRVLGSRHSFTGVADSVELVTLEDMTGRATTPADVVSTRDGGPSR